MLLTEAKNYQDAQGNIIEGDVAECKNVKIFFRGKGNKLIIGKNVKLQNVYIRFDAHKGVLILNDDVQYKGSIRVGLCCEVNIGRGLTITEKCYMSCAERTKIIIGDDCMFASFNQIRTDDAHPIFDLYTKERINCSQSIIIGSHVWLGYEAVILGGSTIGSGCVIGMRSLVKGSFSPHSLVVGSPARVIRDNVAWERTHVNLSPPFEFLEPTHEIHNYNLVKS